MQFYRRTPSLSLTFFWWQICLFFRIPEDFIYLGFDVYTTKRQGKLNVLNTEITFHRSAKESIKNKGVIKKMQGHEFIIQNKKESEKWMKLRK